MPLSLSPAPDVLATIRAYLEQEILPGLRDDKRFTVKVAANMLATIERELRQAPEADAAERTRLAVLTGTEGTHTDLNRVLAEAIRAGGIADDDPRLLDHLRRTTAAALAINNPQWLAQ
jgi:uncharacterized protein DUF6285